MSKSYSQTLHLSTVLCLLLHSCNFRSVHITGDQKTQSGNFEFSPASRDGNKHKEPWENSPNEKRERNDCDIHRWVNYYQIVLILHLFVCLLLFGNTEGQILHLVLTRQRVLDWTMSPDHIFNFLMNVLLCSPGWPQTDHSKCQDSKKTLLYLASMRKLEAFPHTVFFPEFWSSQCLGPIFLSRPSQWPLDQSYCFPVCSWTVQTYNSDLYSAFHKMRTYGIWMIYFNLKAIGGLFLKLHLVMFQD